MTQQLELALKQFTGSQTFYRHPLFRKYVYTEGVKYLAEEAGAYWLIEYVLSNQISKTIQSHPFQVWHLTRQKDNGAIIIVSDGNDNEIIRFHLPFTDFPLQDITLWFIGETLLLPSEY